MGKATQAGFSIRREAATDGGGLGDALATIEVSYVAENTYRGQRADDPKCSLHVVYKVDGQDQPWERDYNVGPSNRYEVSDDGYSVRPTGKSSGGLNRKSGAYFFIDTFTEAVEAQGLDITDYFLEGEDGWSESVEPLDGLRVRIGRKPMEQPNGDKKDQLCVTEIVLDEAPKKNAKGKANGKVSVDDKAIEWINALIAAKTSVKTTDIANLLFKEHRSDPDVKAVMNKAFDKKFLSAGPWELDAKKGILRAI